MDNSICPAMNEIRYKHLIAAIVLTIVGSQAASSTESTVAPSSKQQLQIGEFKWKTGLPLVLPADRSEESCFSIKDPSIVYYNRCWHLFCTVRAAKRTHTIEYLTFTDWKDANTVKRHILKCHSGYFCAPQVFYFTPQSKWYLICQAADLSWEPNYQPAWSTTDDIADPNSWSKLTPLFEHKPANVNAWLDFWVICDDAKAHLFFTSLDGRMWRAETNLTGFPLGWSEPVVALIGDVFEASHTYRLKGLNKYLTLIEAQNGNGWRYYKAYLADRLDGQWEPLAAEKDKAFASMKNVHQTAVHWTDSISHGELVRDGYNQNLQVDPQNLRFLFQGVTDRERQGKQYGEIPWRIGILEPDL